jgi:EAL domain-containing protein (putative c-di-GMP-specific phosphodiesterase class I)
MSDHLEVQDESDRIEALRQYNILDTAAEESFDRITQLASLICNAPVSLLNFIDEDRQWSKAGTGIDTALTELPRDIVFCNQTIMHDNLYEIPDTTKDLIFMNNPLVTTSYKVRFYAGVPLINPEGFRLGALCVLDMQPKTLTEDQRKSLSSLAKLAVEILETKRLKENLNLLLQVNDSIDCNILIFDSKTWKCKLANIQALTITNYTLTEMMNLDFQKLFLDLKISGLHTIIDSIINNEIPHFIVDTKLTGRNNTLISVQLSISIRKVINSSDIVVAFLNKEVSDSKSNSIITDKSTLIKSKSFDSDVSNEVLQQKTQSQSTTKNIIKNAILNSEFIMYYQPIINSLTGKLSSCEALLRWKDASGNVSLPQNFIKVAEESDLILEIGEWALKTVSNQIAVWKKNGTPIVPVAVNLSTQQLKQNNFIEMIESILKSDMTCASEIILELTESTIVENYSLVSSKMETLKKLGFKFSLDDFGTGYSSLSYLTRFPLDKIKIDKSFISAITSNATSCAIIKSVISLAKNLKLAVVAEGVETQDQLTFLQKLSCDEIQGYLISKPISSANFENNFLNNLV